MSWLKKLFPSRIKTAANQRRTAVPEGLWSKCDQCDAYLFRSELERNLFVCPKCDHHHRISGRTRLELFLDPEGREELDAGLSPKDFLKFKDSKRYKDRLLTAQKTTGERDALVVFSGRLNGRPVVACAFSFNFIGGSMGAVVGEKFVRAVHHCLTHRIPLICFASSGGARMQESLIALMQMAKTSAALKRLFEANLPYISVMVDPCTGGVSASLAMLGTLHLAEPKALIGFAGPRVIEQTVREKLPEGFQRSEFLKEKGMIDRVCDRRDLRRTISGLLSHFLSNQKQQYRVSD